MEHIFERCTNYIDVKDQYGVLFTQDTQTLLYAPKDLKSYIIPDRVTSIGKGAFKNCTGLTSITIPDSVTKIGDYAFEGCTGLNEPVCNKRLFAFLPKNFKGVYTIPDSVTKIGDYAFEGCTGLTSITIPDSVTKIGWGAFKNCTSLTSITIPDSVTKIGSWAFSGCTGLTSITIPDSVTEIGNYAFSGCTGLKEILFLSKIPPKIEDIGITPSVICVPSDALEEYRKIFTSEHTTIKPCEHQYGNAKYLPDINSLYAKLALLTRKDKENYTLHPDTIIIAESVFEDCTEMLRVVIPNKVTRINERAFANCTKLRDVVLGEKVEYIAHEAFVGCENIQSLTICACEPPIVENSALDGWDFEIPITIPQSSLKRYQANPIWCQFPNLIEKQEDKTE